jgi:DNA polymerase-1
MIESLEAMDPETVAATAFLVSARNRNIAVDTETNGEDIRDGRGYAMGISIAYRDNNQYHSMYFPFRHRGPGNLPDSVLAKVKEVIETAPAVVFHNAKFDIVSLRTLGIYVRSGTWFCTMIMAHLINENWPYSKSLNSCAAAYVGPEFQKDDSEIKDIVKTFGWGFVPAKLMKKYAALDTELTYRLFLALLPLFKKENLTDYWKHKARLIEVVIEMESRGVAVDVDFCNQMLANADAAMAEHTGYIGAKPTNAQLEKLFIEKLKLPVVKKSPKTGKPSFDREAMGIYEQILERNDNPVAKHILAYRGWQKARSAFYGAYLTHLSPDGRLRPSYKHHKDEQEGGTLTGRLSCANPNLQQIPRVSDKAWNGSVKKAFRASPGYTLYEADYSQLELRLGTAYANEQELKRVFEEGRDIFTELGARLGWARQNVKTFVYSTQYGAGKKRISDVFGVSQERALELINQYYEMFPGFRRVSQVAASECLTKRRARLWSGRYRHFRSPKDDNHKAFNSVIQGGAADIVERIMVALYERVDQVSDGAVRMLLQVHDSVIFEIKNNTEGYWIPKIIEVMEDVNNICTDFGVRFHVDCHRFGGD